MSAGVIGLGGFVDSARREADWRYVIDRLRSPSDVRMRAENAGGETVMCSERAMCSSRDLVAESSNGVNLNLEHRDARGSMILDGC